MIHTSRCALSFTLRVSGVAVQWSGVINEFVHPNSPLVLANLQFTSRSRGRRPELYVGLSRVEQLMLIFNITITIYPPRPSNCAN